MGKGPRFGAIDYVLPFQHIRARVVDGGLGVDVDVWDPIG
jgi:hypothetical protein